MTKPGWLREFCAKVQPLGFEFDGYGGNNHPRFKHRKTGEVYVTSLTPSDWRAERNALAHMERISGKKIARPNAAHYRHQKTRRSDFKKSTGETKSGREIDILLGLTEALRAQFADVTSSHSRRAAQEAREIMADFDVFREELARRYRHIEPLF